jgi:NAD(P)H-nitrite reductase large subunit
MRRGAVGETAAEPTMICRCEEILSDEIAAALLAGARTVNDVKWRTRAGMGLCQGVYCVPVIAAMVAQATGTSLAEVAPLTARPPVRPIALEALADLAEPEAPATDGTGDYHSQDR